MIAQHLRDIGACPPAVKWAGRRRSLQRAWDECPRANWLLWYAEKKNVEMRTLVLAACACASTALHRIPEDEPRPRAAIEASEQWAKGRRPYWYVVQAAEEAFSAYINPIGASTSTEYAYSAAFRSARSVSEGGYGAAFVASLAARSGGRTYLRDLRKMADLVREIIPKVPA